MAIYKGVVTALGSGNIHSSNTSTFVEREYVDIGSKHLRKVFSAQYVDDMLSVALNTQQTIEVSTYRWLGLTRTNVCSIRMANGTVRTAETVFSMLLVVLAFGPILGAILAFVVGLVLSFVFSTGTAVTIGILCGLAYAAYGISGYFRARFAF